MTPEIALARGLAAKPAIKQTLALLAAGQLIISLDHDRKCAYLEECQGAQVRDEQMRKMLVGGGYTLHKAGYLDQFGLVTQEGREFLNGKG
jgi:hypothetical protein